MLWGRLKSLFGTREGGIETVAAAITLVLPDQTNLMYMTGTATVTSLNASRRIEAGRTVWFVQSDSGTTTFTNSGATTTKGAMDLGGASNLDLAQTDVLCLQQRSDGSWLRMFSTDN